MLDNITKSVSKFVFNINDKFIKSFKKLLSISLKEISFVK